MTLKEVAENHGLTPEGVDYALTQYQIVLCEITHGMMSKPSYDAHDIIRTAQERWCDTCDLKEREEETEALMIRAREIIQNAPNIGGWISVKDRLPEATKPDANGNITFSDYVLTYQTYEDGHHWIAEDTCRVDHGCWMHEVPGMGCKVTHWMPLPEGPEEKK